MKDLKAWAWSRPTFGDPIWDKVDEIVDSILETVFGAKVVTNVADKISMKIEKLNQSID